MCTHHCERQPGGGSRYNFEDLVEMIALQNVWDFKEEYADILEISVLTQR